MKKYTDTELLETLLPMLHYSISTPILENAVSVFDTVDFEILENSRQNIDKDFIVALQNRIDELAKKARVEATNIAVDKDEDMCEDVVCEDTECIEKCSDEDEDIGCCPSEDIKCTNRRWGDCEEQTYSSKEYYELRGELTEKDHEIWKLKRTVEALEYLIYNCIPEGDRRKD